MKTKVFNIGDNVRLKGNNVGGVMVVTAHLDMDDDDENYVQVTYMLKDWSLKKERLCVLALEKF